MARALLAALTLLACAPWSSAARPWTTADAEVRAWIERHATSIAGSDGALAMAPMCDALPASAVIALGESSHGVHELKAAQLAVIQCLAARPGPLTVLYELSYDFAWDMNEYVQGDAPLPDLGSGLVGTHDLRATVDWIRDHNHPIAADPRVRIGGLDVYCWAGCLTRVIDYLKAVDPAHAAAAEPRLARLRAGWSDNAVEGPRARAILEQEKAHLLAHRDRYAGAGDPAAWTGAVHELDLLLATTSEALHQRFPRPFDRDRMMADNVEWFRAGARPGETLLVIAHSGHVAAGARILPNDRRSPPSMGEHLRDRLGRDYVPIHMTFRSGTFLGHRAHGIGSERAGHDNPTATFVAADPPRGTLEDMLRGPRGPYVLDLRRLPATGMVAAWFWWEQYTRELGAAWRDSFARWPLERVGWTRLTPAQAFDLVVYLPEATPVVPL